MLWQEIAVSCPAPTYPCPCTRMPHTYIQGEFVPWFVRCAQGYKWPPKPNQQNWQKNGIKLPKNYSICIGPYIGYLSKLRLDVQLPLISSHPNARHIHERGKFLMICAQGHKWLCKPNQQNGQETQRQTTTKLVVTTVEGKILTKRPKKFTHTRIERRKSSRLASAGCSPRPPSDFGNFQLACFGFVTSRCWTEGSQGCESPPQLRHRHLASNAHKTHHPNLQLHNNKALVSYTPTTKFALGLCARPHSLPDSRAGGLEWRWRRLQGAQQQQNDTFECRGSLCVGPSPYGPNTRDVVFPMLDVLFFRWMNEMKTQSQYNPTSINVTPMSANPL